MTSIAGDGPLESFKQQSLSISIGVMVAVIMQEFTGLHVDLT